MVITHYRYNGIKVGKIQDIKIDKYLEDDLVLIDQKYGYRQIAFYTETWISDKYFLMRKTII